MYLQNSKTIHEFIDHSDVLIEFRELSQKSQILKKTTRMSYKIVTTLSRTFFYPLSFSHSFTIRNIEFTSAEIQDGIALGFFYISLRGKVLNIALQLFSDTRDLIFLNQLAQNVKKIIQEQYPDTQIKIKLLDEDSDYTHKLRHFLSHP